MIVDHDPGDEQIAKTDWCRRQTSADRRFAMLGLGKCMNGPRVGNVGRNGVVHGPVVAHGKCQHCLDVHARSR